MMLVGGGALGLVFIPGVYEKASDGSDLLPSIFDILSDTGIEAKSPTRKQRVKIEELAREITQAARIANAENRYNNQYGYLTVSLPLLLTEKRSRRNVRHPLRSVVPGPP